MLCWVYIAHPPHLPENLNVSEICQFAYHPNSHLAKMFSWTLSGTLNLFTPLYSAHLVVSRKFAPPPLWCLIPHVVWLCSMNLKPLHFALRHVFLSLHIRSLLHVSMLQSTHQDDVVVRCPRLQQLRPHKDDAVVRCPRLRQLRPHIRMTQGG